jgi:hypothetical protein
MKRKRKFTSAWGRDAHLIKDRRDVIQARTGRSFLVVGLFAAFLAFGLAFTFSGGLHPYYSLVAALVVGLGTYEIARLQSQGKIP